VNVKGGILGVVVAVFVALGIFGFGLPYLVWGGHSPDWYVLVNFFGSMVIGNAGFLIGSSR
jgi:hypothetical protein